MNNKDLIDKLNKASQFIHEQALKNSSNYIVVSSEVADVLNDLNEKEEKRKNREKKLKRILGFKK